MRSNTMFIVEDAGGHTPFHLDEAINMVVSAD
jgi:hypothetical protein